MTTETKPNTALARAPVAMGQHGLVLKDMDQLIRFCVAVVKSNYFPGMSEPAALLKVQWGAELGVPPMAALQNIHVIDGKLSMSALLIGARIMATGTDASSIGQKYRYRVMKWSGSECEMQWSLDGEILGVSSFNLDEAREANLLQKKNWQGYKKAMLFARALTQGARAYAPAVFFGAIYTPEELGSQEIDGVEVMDIPAPVVARVGVPEATREAEIVPLLKPEPVTVPKPAPVAAPIAAAPVPAPEPIAKPEPAQEAATSKVDPSTAPEVPTSSDVVSPVEASTPKPTAPLQAANAVPESSPMKSEPSDGASSVSTASPIDGGNDSPSLSSSPTSTESSSTPNETPTQKAQPETGASETEQNMQELLKVLLSMPADLQAMSTHISAATGRFRKAHGDEFAATADKIMKALGRYIMNTNRKLDGFAGMTKAQAKIAKDTVGWLKQVRDANKA